MTYSVYNHWDKLKTCVVGKAYPPEFYNWITHTPTREKFQQLSVETEEDFQSLIKLLESFDVNVIRPDIPSNIEDCKVNGILVPPPVAPRDYFIIVRDKLWIPVTPNRNHAKKSFEKQTTLSWQKFCQQDQQKLDKKLNFYKNIFSHVGNTGTCIVPTTLDFISGCFVSRLGQDLYFSTQTIHDDWDEIQRQVDILFPDTDNHIVDAQGHGDAMYCPVAPGLILSIAGEDYSENFPNWEVVYVPPGSHEKQFATSMKLNAGKWYLPGFEKNQQLIDTVEEYFSEWIGNASETVWGVNILIIDKNNIVVAEQNKEIIEACAKRNIKVHVCPFRHKLFWDAGTHCITNDLDREGVA